MTVPGIGPVNFDQVLNFRLDDSARNLLLIMQDGREVSIRGGSAPTLTDLVDSITVQVQATGGPNSVRFLFPDGTNLFLDATNIQITAGTGSSPPAIFWTDPANPATVYYNFIPSGDTSRGLILIGEALEIIESGLDSGATFIDLSDIVDSPATIVQLDPTTGPAAGGTLVSIITTFTKSTGTFAFDGINAPITFRNPNYALVTAPAHAAAVVDVTYTDDRGTITDPGAYTYT